MSIKGVYYHKRAGKWAAQYWNKELKTTLCIGVYDTKEEAQLARVNHIANVYDGVIDDSIPKTRGLPKGIKVSESGNYSATLQYVYGKWNNKHANVHIGTYTTIEEAVEARTQFILGLL